MDPFFQGASELTLDAKGRLAIPTKHREGLQASPESKLVLTAHPDRCLLMYPAHVWEPIRVKVSAFSSIDPQANLWKRMLLGYADETELDSAGRLLISPALRKFANLDRQIMMAGQGSHFELWDSGAWDAQIARLDEATRGLPPGLETFSL